jgi:hypothetical protein
MRGQISHTKLLGELGRHCLGLKQRRVLALDAFVGCLRRPTSNGLPVDIRRASARRACATPQKANLTN